MSFSHWNKRIQRKKDARAPTPLRKNSRRPARLQLEQLEDRMLLDSSGKQYVLRLFDDLFQRPADTAGLQFWSGFLDQGVSHGQVALGLLESQEHQVQELGGLYGSLLRRGPDLQGLSGFLHLLQTGGRLDQVETAILGSSEYFQRSQGRQDSFLVSIYHDVLGRAIDPAGRDQFTAALQQGATRTEVAAAIVNSHESHQGTVQQLFVRYLDRTAESFGLQALTNALDQGAPEEQVLAGILGSTEYFNHFVATPAPSAANRNALSVPGQPGQTVTAAFAVTGVDSAFADEFGIFPVDDASGRIGILHPADPGYAAAALAQPGHRVVFGRPTQGEATSFDLPGGSFIGLYLVQNNTTAQVRSQNPSNLPGQRPLVFFSFASANPDRLDHLRQTGSNQFAFEDLFAGGDLDFNDLEVRVDFTQPAATDRQPPTVRLTGPASGLQTRTNATITGQALDNLSGVGSVEAKLDSGLPFPLSFDGNGNFRFVTSLALDGSADSVHTMAVRATDKAGNVSAFVSATFTLDTIPPAVDYHLDPASDTPPVGDSHTEEASVTLTGTTEPNTPVVLLETGASTTSDPTNGVFSFTGVALGLGPTTFTVRATDRAGNAGTAQHIITRDAPLAATTLVEGTRFLTPFEQTFIVPAQPSKLEFRFANLNFDTHASFIKDAFEASLTDANGNTLVLPIAGSRDAFLNITEGQAPVLSPNVQLSGGTVDVDLSNITAGTQARLRVRLINNDSDTTSSVEVSNGQVIGGGMNTPNAVTPSEPATSVAKSIDFAALADVTASMTATYSQTSLNEKSNVLFAGLTLINTGSYPVDSPLVAVITHLSDPSVRVRNSDGTTPDGSFYFDFSGLIGGSILAPGQATAARTLAFFDPNGIPFTYDLVVMGQLNRPPAFTSEPNSEAILGIPYVYQATAADPDHDTLTFSLLTAPDGMTVDPASGKIAWNPQPSDLGAQAVLLQVDDGQGGTAQQQYTVSAIVAPPNRPPVFTSTPVVDANVNTAYTYRAAGSDADGDTLTFSVVTGPQGLVIDSASGLVTWSPAASQLGMNNVTLKVDDGRGGSVSQRYVIGVGQEPGNHAPLIVSDPVTKFNLPGSTNPATGDVNPGSLSLDLGLGESATTTVSLTLPGTPPPPPPPRQTLPLTLGSAVGGNITVPFAEDDYTFSLATPSLLYFDSLTNNSVFVWTLAGPAGTAVSNQSFTSSENSNPVLNLPAGDYTLSVVGSNDATGVYQFRLSNLAGPESLSPGTPLSGALDPANETDLIRFTASAAQRFFFDVQALSGAPAARWRLVDPFGNILFNQSLSKDVDTMTLTQAGAYTLLLEGFSADTVTGTYTVNVQPVTTVSQVLTLGNVVTGSIGVTGEQDQYTFSLAASSLLYFDSQTNNGNLTWTLTGPAGTAVSNRSFTDLENSFAVLNLPAGDYTVTVDGAGDATPAYQFRLSDLAQATALTPGTAVSGTLNPASATDLFRFTAAAGDQFLFQVQNRTGAVNARWRLVDPFGNVLFNAPFNSNVSTLTLAQPGSYTALLEGAIGDTGSGNYTINVQPMGNVPPTPLTGSPLTLGTTVSGSIAVAGGQDQYLVTLAAPSLLYFDSLTANGNLNWTLVGPAGTAVNTRPFNQSDDGFVFGNPVLNLPTGTYQLTVAGAGSITGAYQFRLWDLAQASPLTPGTPVSGALDPHNETDLYRFTAAAGDRFFFDTQARTGASFNENWRLVDPFGNILFNTGFTSAASDVDTLTLAQPGSYTLLLEGRSSDTGSSAYTINVQPVPNPSRQALTLGSVVTGSISITGEQDQYTFNLAAPSLLYFDSLTANGNLNWTLVGPAGAAVNARPFNQSDGGFVSGSANPVLSLVAGEYTLTVDGSGDITGAYQFRLSDLAQASPLTPSTPVSDTLDPHNETDLYRFTAAAGDRFFFDTQARSGSSSDTWRLVDPFGNILFNTDFTTTGSDVDTLTLAQPGSYTLLLEGRIVDSGSSPYTINVQPVPNPSTQALTLGSLVAGSISITGEQDQYTFNLAAPALADFDSLTFQRSLNWTLTGPARTPVNSRQFSASDSTNFSGNPVLDLGAGTYTLTVDGSGDFTGAYQFVLRNLADAISVTPGTPVSGNLDPANETDLFRFTASAGNRFFFDVQAISGVSNGSWRLVDPLGNMLFNSSFNSVGSDVDTLTITQSGVYTLLLEGAISNTGIGTYRINVQPVTFVSRPLTLGNLVSGSITVPGGQDRYTFNLAAPALVYFDALTSNGSMTLTGPAGTAVNNLDFTSTFPVLNLIAGDYTLTVDGFGDFTGPYQFRLSDLAQAISLTPGTPVSGTLDPATETDLFRFTADAGDQFFFDVQARSGASQARWLLVDPFGNILFNTFFNADVSTLTLARPGSYTLLLEGGSSFPTVGSYTFNVQPMGNVPQTPLTGAPLTLGTTVSDSIAVAGEQDRYLFTLAAPSLLYFDSLTDNSNLNWTLVGPAGTAVSNRSFTASDAGSIFLSINPVLNLVAGTYQLTIAASGSATGAYQFRMLDLAQASPLTLATPVNGQLNPANGTDLYKFSVAAAGRFAFDVLNNQTNKPFDAFWRLIDPFGNVVFASAFSTPQAVGLDRPGIYTLLLEGFVGDSGIGAYRLSVRKTPPGFAPGDVFISVNNGKVQRYDKDLNLLDILSTQIPAITAGMAFDSSHRLYVTNFSASSISRLDSSGTVIAPNPFVFGDPNSVPESIVFDAAGNFYVGQAPGQLGPDRRNILKFSPQGIPLDRFDVLDEDRGSDWVELAADQRTIFYTSEGQKILRYDLSAHIQLPSFATLPGSHAYALRILPDNSVLVADSEFAVHVSQSGQVVQTYTAPGATELFALNLDPDGTSFWTADIENGTVFKFDIASGTVLESRKLPGVGRFDAAGVTVFGELTAATSRVDVVASDPAVGFTNLSGPVAGIPEQPSTFQAQFTGDGDAHSFDLLFVRAGTGDLLGSLPVRINTFYFYPVQAIDPDGDSLTYSLPVAPAGATIAADTGRITFDPPAEGDYRFRVQVDDGRGGQALQDYKVHVSVGAANEAPVITSTAPTQAETGKSFGYAVTASDPDQDILSFYLTTAPAGMSIDRTTGVVTWTPTNAQVGQQSATVLVLDGHGGRATQSIDVSVALFVDNHAPIFDTLPPTSAVALELFRYQAAATDPDNDVLFFDLVVKLDGMAVDGRTGLVFWQPDPDQVGTHDIILRVQDPRGGVDLQAFRITVDPADVAPVITSTPSNSAVAGLPYAYQVAAQDADGDPLTYQLTTLPAGMVIDATTGLLSWTPTAAQLGSQAVTISVSDGRGGQGTQSFSVTVLATAPNHPPVFTSTPRTTIRLGSGYLYALTASDPDGDRLTFHLDQAPAGMAITAAGLITWMPQAAQFGANAVTARVDDGRGGSTTQDFSVTVLAQGSNRSPNILSAPPLNTVVGRSYRYNAIAEDPDGDPLTWLLEVAPAGMSLDPLRGALRWTPTTADLGPQDVELRVGDTQGSFATQRFTISVRGVNSPPVITATPPTEAAVGRPYGYVVGASDADGDTLSFSLTAGPAGMTIDAGTGLIQWTPDSSQVGQQQVEVGVADGQGGAAAQSFTVMVSNSALNRAPRITSHSVLVAIVSQPYQYQVTAFDLDGDSLRFDLPRGPNGMSIDPITGLLQWTPDTGQAGNQSVVVTATDPAGNVGFQSYTLKARGANQPPVINSAPVTVAMLGSPYHYDLLASDPDGDSLSYTLVAGPPGMVMDGLGRITWVPGLADVGVGHVSLRVADEFGEPITQDYDIQVSADSVAPKVSILLSANRTDLKKPVPVLVSATDDVGVQTLTLTANGVAVPLDSDGRATLPADLAGPVKLVAAASDAAGNTGTAQATLLVIDPFDADAPVVDLTGPNEGAVIMAPTDVIGTVRDANLFFYKLEVARVGSDSFTEFARGTTSVDNGVLGQFDPSLLADDSYVLRLTAEDSGGHVAITERTVNVAGSLKLGNFTLSFTDLTIPVVGIPITVTRTYDTLNAGTSTDVGFGWRLAFRDVDLRTSVPPTGHEGDVGLYNPFRDRTHVSLTLPGGLREGFTFQPEINRATRFLIGIGLPEEDWQYDPKFVPDAGVIDELTLSGATTMIRDPDTGEFFSIGGSRLAFNPADPVLGIAYTLTTKDGIAYQIDAATGELQRVLDSKGNSLGFSAAGISSSSGQQVTVQRDPQGRIVAITDPNGNQLHYQYDVQGDLTAVTDFMGNVTRLVYKATPAHFLDQVLDPLGRTGSRTEYDAQGRLVTLLDAAGNPVQFTYDVTHSLETVKDQLGNPTTFAYDDRGNIVTQIDALGGITHWTFDADNNMLTDTDPLGRTSTFTYDDRGDVLTKTDPLGNTTISTYFTFTFATSDVAGPPFTRLTTSTDPLGNTTHNGYDSKGNLVAQIDPLGNTTTTSNDAAGNPTVITDPLGNVTHDRYDATGYRTQLVDADGHVVNFTNDANGNPLSQMQLDGGGWSLTYNADGLPTSAGLIGLPRTVNYDALNHITQLTESSGQTTTLRYDALGHMTQITLPDGTTAETRTYDAVGNLAAVTDSLGNVTGFAYDANKRLLQTLYPDGSTEKRTYDLAGELVEVTDALGTSTRYVYDGAGRKIQIIDGLGGIARTQYDVTGRIVAVTDPLGRTSRYEYDADGRRVATVGPDGSTTRNVYDAGGRLVQTVNAAGNVTTNAYDATGNLLSVTDAIGNVTSYQYGDQNERVAISDAKGNITRFRYDTQGHLVETTQPDGETDSSTYDSSGQPASTTNGNGQTVRYGYDVRRRLISRTLPDGSQETYTYTSDGLISSVSDANGTTRYDYDPVMRRLVRVSEPDGRYIRYAYDARGYRTLLADSMGAGLPEDVTQYVYDALGRLIQVTDPQSGVTSYTYDADGNLTTTTLPNGVTETDSYDDWNRVIDIVAKNGGGATISSFSYTLDANGNRTREDDADGSHQVYTYDALDRVMAEEHFNSSGVSTGAEKYSYDSLGNVTARSGTLLGNATLSYNGDNQLVSGAGSTYAYDGAGNLVSVTDSTGNVTHYSYDDRGRLASSQGPDGATTSYTYDFQGVRQSQQGPGGLVKYLVDAANGPASAQVVRESDSTGATLRSYVLGLRLLSFTEGGNIRYYLTDGLGSTRLLTNPTGAVTDTYLYSAYGVLLGRTGSSANPFLFAGQQQDGASGLLYLRARYYDPATGRFLSRDAFAGSDRLPLSLNKYLYALANPLNRTDPSGNQTLIEVEEADIIAEEEEGAEASVSYEEALQTEFRVEQIVGGILTLVTAGSVLADPARIGGYFGGNFVFEVGAKERIGAASEPGLIGTGIRMLTSRATYIDDPFIPGLAQVFPGPGPDTIYVLPELRFLTIFPRPATPLELCQVGILVHEFAHLAFPGIILDYFYGINSLRLPPLQALENADNYMYAVQAFPFGISAEEALMRGG